ncbi:MAG: GYD domain-containing protein [Chloroflexi bacterium]|nr:GYD domain-containing protein [Chloroflexota bacterium]
MPRYLYEVAYTPEAWAELVKKPQDRIEAIRPAVRKLGGKIESAYFAFGDYDIVAIANMPDNVSAAAFSLAVSAGGSVKSIRTTPLMTIREGMRAMRQAKRSGYTPASAD